MIPKRPQREASPPPIKRVMIDWLRRLGGV